MSLIEEGKEKFTTTLKPRTKGLIQEAKDICNDPDTDSIISKGMNLLILEASKQKGEMASINYPSASCGEPIA